jgi:NifB/MoaA-like Fe-S oxidoreductase
VGLTKFRFQGKAPTSIRAAIQIHETPEWIDTNWERQSLWSDNQPPRSTPTDDGSGWGFCSRLGAATDVPLRCYTPAEAAQLIDSVEPYQQHFNRELGYSLVYPSDEFYILCGRDLPPAAAYDDFPQYSNGVGMTREFIDGWKRARRRLPPRLPQPSSVALVCGTLIAPVMQPIVERLNRVEGLDVHLLPVVNEFFGETVTVSGLLMGQDVAPALRASGCTRALLPRVMFDHQGMRTLDEYSPQQIAEESGVEVAVAHDADDLVAYVRELAQAVQSEPVAAA